MSKSITKKGFSLQRANKVLKIEESKLDRYLYYYMGEVLRTPDPQQPHAPALTDTELKMLMKYERVYEMMDIGRTDGMIRSFMMKEYDLQDRQARYIMEEARILYGVTGMADKEGKRRASINYLRTLSNLAFKEKQYETAGRLWEKADELEGLKKADEVGFDPEDFLKPVQVVFINNLTLEKAKKNQTIEIDE